jgi:thiol-disulfide isomerase/thioredoxin
MLNPPRLLITPRRLLIAIALLLLAGIAAVVIDRATTAFMRFPQGASLAPVKPSAEAAADSADLSLSFADPPAAVPALDFVDGDGRSMTLADFRGRVILLNVWATWCVPCRKEMPTLDRLQAKLGGADFQVIALSIDRQGMAVVKPFYRDVGLAALGIYIEQSGKATQLLHAVGVPMTLLIDRQGREVARKMGPAEWDSPEMVAIIRRYLDRPPSTHPAALPVEGSQQHAR